MKHIKSLIFGVGAALTLSMSFGSCTDDFDDTNRNPNKLYETKFAFTFPGVVYNSMKTLQETNYRYVVSLARYNVHWFQQGDTEDFNKLLEFYTKSLKDLKKLENTYTGVEGQTNTLGTVLTWKCYLYYHMVTTWGAIPMSDANQDEVQTDYKYDSQEEIYKYLLTTLDNVVAGFDVNGDQLNSDPVFDGDIAQWRKFANTLRLQIALTIQNSDPTLAEEHIRKAFKDENAGYILDKDAVFQFGTDLSNDASWVYNAYTQQFDNGTNSGWTTYGAMSHNFYLYMKSYDDPRITKFTQPAEGKTRAILANDTLTKNNSQYPNDLTDSIIVRYRIPYYARLDNKQNAPAGWRIGIDPNSDRGEEYRSPTGNVTKGTNDCIVSYDFMKADAIMPLFTQAEVNFMKAEVALKYPGVLTGSAQQYYEDGIRASMNYWGISTADINAYMQRDGIKWDTDGKGVWEFRGLYKADINGHGGDEAHLEQIYKQWYIADFFNGFAGWILERRTRAMNYQPHFYNGTVSIQGSNGICDWMMERLLYPQNEKSANYDEYIKACQLLQKESPDGNTVRDGDNFFTMLRFAKKRTGYTIEDWVKGEVTVSGDYLNAEIHYHSDFLMHPYGTTHDEVLKTLKAKDDAELKTLVDYSANKVPYSICENATGKLVEFDSKTGKVKLNPDGTFKYVGEEWVDPNAPVEDDEK